MIAKIFGLALIAAATAPKVPTKPIRDARAEREAIAFAQAKNIPVQAAICTEIQPRDDGRVLCLLVGPDYQAQPYFCPGTRAPADAAGCLAPGLTPERAVYQAAKVAQWEKTATELRFERDLLRWAEDLGLDPRRAECEEYTQHSRNSSDRVVCVLKTRTTATQVCRRSTEPGVRYNCRVTR